MTRNYEESQEQIAALDWVRLQHPWLIKHTIYIKNEGKTSLYRGHINKKLGVLKGASDLFIAYPSRNYCGLFIEVKTKKGKPTFEQEEFIKRMLSVGYYAIVCYGADEIIHTIRWYLDQKGTSSAKSMAKDD